MNYEENTSSEVKTEPTPLAESSSEPAPESQGVAEKYHADLSDSIEDGSGVWVVDSDSGSFCEMTCPKDDQEAGANLIASALNERDSLVKQRNEALDQCTELHERLARYEEATKELVATAETYSAAGDNGKFVPLATKERLWAACVAAREVIAGQNKEDLVR